MGRKYPKISARRYTQLITAVLYNCNFKGFAKGNLFTGSTKGICVPGLNCYSCPGAVTACPLGSLQSGLASSKYRIPYYVIGTLLLFGILLGRLICGFLCPFGFLQELLHKIPVPKIKKSRFTRILSYLKYVILLVFAIAIPLVKLFPGFCKYICPAGTLEGAVPLIIADEGLRENLGFLFSWKVFILAATLLICMFCYRAFCRFICPLGAFYSLFNPISVFGVKVDENKCTHCNACVKNCRMDVHRISDHECIQCGECMKDCEVKAISFGYKGPGASADKKQGSRKGSPTS